jgi:hypothetical protein
MFSMGPYIRSRKFREVLKSGRFSTSFFPLFEAKYCHGFMVSWLIITVSGLDDWIYWYLPVQSSLIAINYNSSNQWLPVTRSILVLILFILNSQFSKSKSHCDWRSVSQSVRESWCRAPSEAHDQIFITLLTVTVLFFVGRPLWR